jgi:hypothetical protein
MDRAFLDQTLLRKIEDSTRLLLHIPRRIQGPSEEDENHDDDTKIPRHTILSNRSAELPHNEGLCDACSKVPLKALLSNFQEKFTNRTTEAVMGLTPSSLSHCFQPPLLVSSDSTCSFCRLLAASFNGDTVAVRSLNAEELGDTSTLGGNNTRSFCIRVSTSTELNSEPRHQLKQDIRIAVLGSDAFRLSSRRFSYARRIAPQQVDRDLMKSWLESCSKHEICNIVSDVRHPISKLLIDVDSMCVVDVGCASEEYFALSYVWGNTSSLQMVKANKNSLMTTGYFNDNIQKLSPVVQDAITIARELSSRYLWVDRLCICQDDANTKHKQISIMNHIYKEAKATLAAVTRNDASSGLPGVRPVKSSRLQYVEFVSGMHLTVLLPSLSEIQSRYFQRAWTYQEERLSRRILYFAEEQVHFGCLRSICCEDRWEDVSPYPRGGQILHDIYPHTPFGWWKIAVSEFSAREYSNLDDKYNAFQGIAAELRERWMYPCVVAALCWKSSSESKRISCLPSWTWCGWSGYIEFPSSEVISLIPSLRACTDTEYPFESGLPIPYSSFKSGPKESSSEKLEGKDEASADAAEFKALEFPQNDYAVLEGPFPLVLDFFALSALLELKFCNGSWGLETDDSDQLTGLISIAYDRQLTDTIWKVECVRLGTTDDHTHFQSEQNIVKDLTLQKRFKERLHATELLKLTRTLIILIIECKSGDVHQRIGLGSIKESCFMASHPIERKVRLG